MFRVIEVDKYNGKRTTIHEGTSLAKAEGYRLHAQPFTPNLLVTVGR